ncbi:MAG: hypothetical protein AABZ15_11685 [Nitrospirota bacterium]
MSDEKKTCGQCGRYNLGKCMRYGYFISARGLACESFEGRKEGR